MGMASGVENDAQKGIKQDFEYLLKQQPDREYAVKLLATWIETPLGTMLAVADNEHLHLLSYVDTAAMERKAELLQQRLDASLEMGTNGILQSITDEIAAYFDGVLREFATPFALGGTTFQLNVWDKMQKIPFGSTLTYTELAAQVDRPAAFRAVAQASSQNPVVIIVPCHRVINAEGRLGGYSGGLERKKWLIDFEQEILLTDD